MKTVPFRIRIPVKLKQALEAHKALTGCSYTDIAVPGITRELARVGMENLLYTNYINQLKEKGKSQ